MRRAVLFAAALACSCGKSTPAITKVENGVRVTYSSPSGGDIDAIATVVRRRLAQANMPAVITTKDGLMVVEVPTPRDEESLAHMQDLIAITARLDVRPLDDKSPWLDSLVAAMPLPAPITTDLDHWMDTVHNETHTTRFLWATDREDDVDRDRAKKLHCLYGHAAAHDDRIRCRITGRQAIEEYLATAAAASPLYKLADDHEVLFERTDDRTWRTHLALRQSPVALDQVTASATDDSDVEITLPPPAKAAFAKLTGEVTGHKLAFVVDGRVVSAPVIAGAITGGKFTLVHVKEPALLVNALRGGSLPAPIVEESVSKLKDGKVLSPP